MTARLPFAAQVPEEELTVDRLRTLTDDFAWSGYVAKTKAPVEVSQAVVREVAIALAELQRRRVVTVERRAEGGLS